MKTIQSTSFRFHRKTGRLLVFTKILWFRRLSYNLRIATGGSLFYCNLTISKKPSKRAMILLSTVVCYYLPWLQVDVLVAIEQKPAQSWCVEVLNGPNPGGASKWRKPHISCEFPANVLVTVVIMTTAIGANDQAIIAWNNCIAPPMVLVGPDYFLLYRWNQTDKMFTFFCRLLNTRHGTLDFKVRSVVCLCLPHMGIHASTSRRRWQKVTRTFTCSPVY